MVWFFTKKIRYFHKEMKVPYSKILVRYDDNPMIFPIAGIPTPRISVSSSIDWKLPSISRQQFLQP